MPIPKPQKDESQNDFLQRCMSDHNMIKEYTQEQRAAICRSTFEELATEKISFDFDGTLDTQKGLDLALEYKNKGSLVYIISARDNKDKMLPRANKAGILFSRVYATGSNQAKIEKIKELGINKHYDNNPDVIKELGNIGQLI